jgi:tripeptide aminopeptidase
LDVSRQDLLGLFLQLVEIPSPSGHERDVADFVLAYLRDAGLEPVEDDSAARTGAGSGNIFVRVPGRGAGTPILLAAHMDTVAVTGAIRAVVEDGVVTSADDTILGADDKTAVTLLLMLLCELAAEPPGGDVEVLFTTCEEVGLRGAKVFDSSGLAAQAGFVFDSSGPLGRIITAAPTQKTLVADFKGVAAHAGIEPQKGRSAVVAAARAVAAMTLGRIDEATTANVGLISGGVATNIVPEHCRVEAEARSREPARLSAQIADMLAAVNEAATLVGVDVATSVVEEYAAFDIDPEALPVRLAWRALEAVGLEPSLGATGGGSDVNVFNAKGLPSVNLDIGFEDVHTAAEHMPVDRLLLGYQLVRALVAAAAG